MWYEEIISFNELVGFGQCKESETEILHQEKSIFVTLIERRTHHSLLSGYDYEDVDVFIFHFDALIGH